MFFSASIKPTSTVQTRWTARSQVCGFIQGVCFVRRNTKSGLRYIAEKLTESQIAQLKNNVAVVIAVTAIRIPEQIEELPEPPVVPEMSDVKIPLPPKRVKTK